MSDFFESFLTPPPPPHPLFTFYNLIFLDPPKIGHHLWTIPYVIFRSIFFRNFVAITWHDIQQLSINYQNLPSLFNLWTECKFVQKTARSISKRITCTYFNGKVVHTKVRAKRKVLVRAFKVVWDKSIMFQFWTM